MVFKIVTNLLDLLLFVVLSVREDGPRSDLLLLLLLASLFALGLVFLPGSIARFFLVFLRIFFFFVLLVLRQARYGQWTHISFNNNLPYSLGSRDSCVKSCNKIFYAFFVEITMYKTLLQKIFFVGKYMNIYCINTLSQLNSREWRFHNTYDHWPTLCFDFSLLRDRSRSRSLFFFLSFDFFGEDFSFSLNGQLKLHSSYCVFT